MIEPGDELAAQLGVGGQFLGRGDIGHDTVVVAEALLGLLEAGGEVEDWAALLARHHAAVGEAVAIEIARGLVGDVDAFLAAAQEIGVQRVGPHAFGRGGLRGLQRLADDLPAEHPPDPAWLRLADKMVLALARQGKQFDEAGYELGGSGIVGHGFGHGRRFADRPVQRQSTARSFLRTR